MAEEKLEVMEQEEEVLEDQVEEQETEEEKEPDPNDPIFEGGPTHAQRDAWKEQFGEIYATEFPGGKVFIYRSLRRMEYKAIAKDKESDPLTKEENICQRCVIWPANYDFMDMSQGEAGIPSVLSEYIMAQSGFQTITEPVKL